MRNKRLLVLRKARDVGIKSDVPRGLVFVGENVEIERCTALKEREMDMASDEEFVKFVTAQLENVDKIRYKKMFGEYAIYCNEKVVALICDNQVYIKPTKAGRAFIGDVVEASPYPGAKPSFLIQDAVEDAEWLSQLVVLTEQELPKPKPKKKKKGFPHRAIAKSPIQPK